LLLEKAGQLLESLDSEERRDRIRDRMLLGQASLAEATGDWPAAERHLQQLLVRSPNDGKALQTLARVLFQQEEPEKALERLRDASAASDNMLTPEAILGQWYQRQGDAAKSATWMRAALEKAPEDAPTRLAAANCLLQNERFQDAIEQADAALNLDPESLTAKILRGNASLLANDFDTAVQFLEKASLQSPGNFVATNNLALALCEISPPASERALEYAELNARRFPERSEALATLGWVLYKLGRLNESEKVLRNAASQEGQKSPALGYYLARVFAERGRTEEARQLLQTALRGSQLFFGRSAAEVWLRELESRKQQSKSGAAGASAGLSGDS
jgi:tetratricopeptide (TPR) repeat protein